MPVNYAAGYEREVDAEFRAFLAANSDQASDSLALLHHIARTGWGGLENDQREELGTWPYTHKAAGWGVFFEVIGRWDGPCTVTILLVVEFSRRPDSAAKLEAVGRSRARH